MKFSSILVIVVILAAAGAAYCYFTKGCKNVMSCCKEVCGMGGGSSTNVKTISAEELKQKMATSLGLLVINALKADSYQDCHIHGSVSVPLENLATSCETWDKNHEIVVYCASSHCPVSKQAAQLLMEKGFTNVTAYEGGMKEWKEKGFECQGECKAEYLTK